MSDPRKFGILIGTGGIGSGMFFQLKGDHTLGRNESREGFLLGSRDFCKLHIIAHYVAVLLGAEIREEAPFRLAPIGRVGTDPVGDSLLELMRETGMDTGLVGRDREARTLFSVCFQYPDSAGGNITTAASASSLVSPADIRQALPLLARYRDKAMVLAAPETPLESRLELLQAATEYGALRFCAMNSAELTDPAAEELFRRSDLLSINRDEAEALLGLRVDPAAPEAFLEALAARLQTVNPALKICLTLGATGAWGLAGHRREFVPAAQVTPASTAGAGDATLSGLIVGLGCGLPFILPDRPRRKKLSAAPLESALDLAVLLASLTVLSPDTIHLAADARLLAEHARGLGVEISPAIREILALTG